MRDLRVEQLHERIIRGASRSSPPLETRLRTGPLKTLSLLLGMLRLGRLSCPER